MILNENDSMTLRQRWPNKIVEIMSLDSDNALVAKRHLALWQTLES